VREDCAQLGLAATVAPVREVAADTVPAAATGLGRHRSLIVSKTFDADAGGAELAVEEADEQVVEGATGHRAGVDDARPAAPVEGVAGIQADAGRAVQTLGRDDREVQGGFDLGQVQGTGEVVTVLTHDDLRRDWPLGRLIAQTLAK